MLSNSIHSINRLSGQDIATLLSIIPRLLYLYSLGTLSTQFTWARLGVIKI